MQALALQEPSPLCQISKCWRTSTQAPPCALTGSRRRRKLDPGRRLFGTSPGQQHTGDGASDARPDRCVLLTAPHTSQGGLQSCPPRARVRISTQPHAQLQAAGRSRRRRHVTCAAAAAWPTGQARAAHEHDAPAGTPIVPPWRSKSPISPTVRAARPLRHT